jgi:hypothetical protein
MMSEPARRVYVGTRWTRYLRAPEQFIELHRRYRQSLVPLGEVAHVRYNVKSGADAFFYVKDVTESVVRDLDDGTLKERYGIRPSQIGRLRVVETRDHYRTVLEDGVLKPTVFNLMRLDHIPLTPSDCERRMVVIDGSPEEVRTRGLTRALAYVKWGERQGFQRRPTCQQRVRTVPPYRQWYELRPELDSCLLWSQAWGFRHLVPEAAAGLTANKRLFRVMARDDVDQHVLGAILNSTWAASWKYQFGRYTGQEGYFDTDVIAAQQLLIVDPRRINDHLVGNILEAYGSMRSRVIGPLHLTEKIAPNGRRTRLGIDDLIQPDRRQLDEALALAMGLARVDVKPAIDVLYNDLRHQFDGTRAKEVEALRGKASGAGARLTDEGIADIIAAMVPDDLRKRITDFIGPEDQVATVSLPQGFVTLGTHLMAGEGLVPLGSIEVNGQVIDCGGPDQAEWVQALGQCGIFGRVAVPSDDETCSGRLRAFNAWRQQLLKAVGDLVREHTTNNRKRQARVQQLVVHRVLTGAVAPSTGATPRSTEV